MKDLRELTGPTLAFVAVGVVLVTVISSRRNDGLDAVNVSLLGVVAVMVVLAIAIGNWRSR